MKEELYVLTQSLQQPRVIKRIIEKSGEYKKIIVYGFKRDFYEGNNVNRLKSYPNVEIQVVGTFSDKKYFSRLLLYFKLILLCNQKSFFRQKEVYVFGLDLRLISCFLLNASIYYEISDIMWLYKSGKMRIFLSKLDFYLTKRSKTVVFTSAGFFKYYYSFLPVDKVKIIENKFKTYGKVNPLNSIVSDKIKVAYVGAFRYSNIIKDLLKVFQRNTNYELNFYGDGFQDILKEIRTASENYCNIHYHGPFSNPTDLQGIYAGNNLNFVAYDNTLENERVAMPNKFYESGFFNLPIVCTENTFVGERVTELGMGWQIQPDEKSIEQFLKHVSVADLIKCHQRIQKLDKSLFESE